MDPGWSACPYCSGGIATNADEEAANYGAQGSSRAPTLPEGSPAQPPSNPPRPPVSSRRKTEFGGGSIRPDEMPTVRNPMPNAPLRRIAAIMVSYTWRPDGEVHPVREGRNYIGTDADCEIYVKDDPQMSSRHATIIYRGKGTQFVIDDEKSMNGTYLDDKSVDVKQPLRNYAKIRTGATIWKFIMLEPEETTGV